jgi:CheY-like chemotaxis protein
MDACYLFVRRVRENGSVFSTKEVLSWLDLRSISFLQLLAFIRVYLQPLRRPAIVRILLAEDFAPYRSLIASLLDKDSECQVIGEASDGLEVLRKVEELRPDLIFMDIGLPELDGLEVARRVLRLKPAAKIVFLTQETDRDIVREALDLGASGYVLKQQVEADLPAAIAAALQGKCFVSNGLSGDGFESAIGSNSSG